MPKHLYSPTYLLHIRKANSFELANFLVCLLLGLGYNAYVVSGYASREQALCDRKMQNCPYLPPEPEPEAPPAEIDKSKYRPKSPPDFKSKFIEEMEARERKKVEEELALREEQRKRMIIELERPQQDHHFGQRVHGWVLLLPCLPEYSVGAAAEISEPTFVEPSTGASYSPSDLSTANLYLGVESLWNHRNYWVNLQDCTEGCMRLQWDLEDPKLYEHLLAGEPRELRNVEDDEDEEVNVRRDFHMVMPASYIERIEIPYKDYELRYPKGRKTWFFKKSKVELFGPYACFDGLVQRVTKYEDYHHKTPIYVYEKYSKRVDRLERTEKDLTKELVTDFYTFGRADFCKSHQYYMNSSDAADEIRTLEFHDGKRLDDLYRMKMHPLYLSQNYKNRPDCLFNRHCEYSSFNEDDEQNESQNRAIMKIVEKFHRNEEIPVNKDIAIREFNFIDNRIRLTYHYDVGQYTQPTRTFIKPPVAERGDKLVFTPDMTEAYNPDPLAVPDDFDDVVDELEKQLIEEELSVAEVRKAEFELNIFLKVRAAEHSNPKLEVSVFDPIRNEAARIGLLEQEEKMKAQSKREIEGDADVLAPYLARVGNLKYLTQKQAEQIRDDCLNDFKQTMVDRANNILREFEKYSDELQKLQSILSKSEGLSKEEKEVLVDKTNQIGLKLRTLEVRLDRHRNLVTHRYRKISDIVKTDPRLAILYDYQMAHAHQY